MTLGLTAPTWIGVSALAGAFRLHLGVARKPAACRQQWPRQRKRPRQLLQAGRQRCVVWPRPLLSLPSPLPRAPALTAASHSHLPSPATEPSSPSCVVGTRGVTCPTDAEGINAVNAMRAALPKGSYLLSSATFHVGCYGEGAFVGAQPVTKYTGINLAMARSTGGSSLDLINIMSYDAGGAEGAGARWGAMEWRGVEA